MGYFFSTPAMQCIWMTVTGSGQIPMDFPVISQSYPNDIPVNPRKKIRYPLVGWLRLRMSRILTMTYGEVVAGVAIVYPFPGRIFVAIQILMFRLNLIGKPRFLPRKVFNFNQLSRVIQHSHGTWWCFMLKWPVNYKWIVLHSHTLNYQRVTAKPYI